jgi:hypothetical protein
MVSTWEWQPFSSPNDAHQGPTREHKPALSAARAADFATVLKLVRPLLLLYYTNI